MFSLNKKFQPFLKNLNFLWQYKIRTQKMAKKRKKSFYKKKKKEKGVSKIVSSWVFQL